MHQLADKQYTQMCIFLSQEVREISYFFVAPPRAFPLSVCATFTREIQIVTKKCTHLSKAGLPIPLDEIIPPCAKASGA